MNTSGYISIDINGQTVGLKFGLPAIQDIGEYGKQEHFYQGDTYSVYGIAYIILAGYQCNQRVKQQVAELSFETICDFVEESLVSAEGGEKIKQVFECFNNSRYMAPHKDAPAEPANTKKKNLTGSKSNASATVS